MRSPTRLTSLTSLTSPTSRVKKNSQAESYPPGSVKQLYLLADVVAEGFAIHVQLDAAILYCGSKAAEFIAFAIKRIDLGGAGKRHFD